MRFNVYLTAVPATPPSAQLLLFWNVFWTLLPVLGIGIFDRNLDANVIMQVPEVYRYGIENRWFGLYRFSLYMIDGIYAVSRPFPCLTCTHARMQSCHL